MSKICFKCKVEKDLDLFYKHPEMADGRVNKCKECNKKDVRENRDSKKDYYLEYDRNRPNQHKRNIDNNIRNTSEARVKARCES